MNKFEKEMRDILKKGKEFYSILATKAEFEAEGTRTDELLRLLEIAHSAGVEIALKIGGCEAIKDMYEAKQFGVDYLIAPMIETPYALSKYITAKNRVFADSQFGSTKFLFNVETNSTYQKIDEIVQVASHNSSCDGIVFGRVDFSGSLGLTRNDIESNLVIDPLLDTAQRCKNAGLEFVVGGAVSIDALPNLQKINDVYLTRFETRKVIFSADALEISKNELEKGLKSAVRFELLWLINKREYYCSMYSEDDKRIKMLEDRWKVLNQEYSI